MLDLFIIGSMILLLVIENIGEIIIDITEEKLINKFMTNKKEN